MRKKGFSAVETMISLALFLMIVMAVFEVFGLARGFFLKIKKGEEETQAAMAALDKMRIDLLQAGSGLSQAIRLGIIEGIKMSEESLTILNLQETLLLSEDLAPGTQRIILGAAAAISPGREICLINAQRGERRSVLSCKGKVIVLASPLEFFYRKKETQVLLVETISLYLDKGRSTIRRQVNLSSPQPLLEDVYSFDFGFDAKNNLARVNFVLKANEEKTYELLVFPKNIALSLRRS
ncbi:MAG: hypothetical protein QHH14_13460 [Clostridiales bacterium]|nr:hypothetical protein [Clostridiales bacterium]